MTRLTTNNLTFFQPTSLLRELIILDEIRRNTRITQSMLAERAGIVPAMVNNYIKAFIKKGYVEAEGNNRDMKYVVTTQGDAHKTSLLMSYFQEAVGLYKNVKEEIQKKLDEVKKEGINTIVLYGAAETAEITIGAAEKAGLDVVGVVDTDVLKHGREFFGRTIQAPEAITDHMPDAVIVASSGYQDEIYNQVQKYESQGIKIRKL